MRKPTLRVRLYAPKIPEFCRLRAYVSKGKAVPRKYITSEIVAPGSELNKFVPNGVLEPGAKAPEWLQKEIGLFMEATQEVAQAYDVTGNLKETPSKEMTDRVRAVIQAKRGEGSKVQTMEERG